MLELPMEDADEFVGRTNPLLVGGNCLSKVTNYHGNGPNHNGHGMYRHNDNEAQNGRQSKLLPLRNTMHPFLNSSMAKPSLGIYALLLAESKALQFRHSSSPSSSFPKAALSTTTEEHGFRPTNWKVNLNFLTQE
jgi:hypothetical protein